MQIIALWVFAVVIYLIIDWRLASLDERLSRVEQEKHSPSAPTYSL